MALMKSDPLRFCTKQEREWERKGKRNREKESQRSFRLNKAIPTTRKRLLKYQNDAKPNKN